MGLYFVDGCSVEFYIIVFFVWSNHLCNTIRVIIEGFDAWLIIQYDMSIVFSDWILMNYYNSQLTTSMAFLIENMQISSEPICKIQWYVTLACVYLLRELLREWKSRSMNEDLIMKFKMKNLLCVIVWNNHKKLKNT